jgi:hypothetical protein
MTDDSNKNIRRNKDKKLSKHYDILINGKKVKILNYRIKNYKDSSVSGRVIELISQLKFDKAGSSDVIIEIDAPNEKLTVAGTWKFG